MKFNLDSFTNKINYPEKNQKNYQSAEKKKIISLMTPKALLIII